MGKNTLKNINNAKNTLYICKTGTYSFIKENKDVIKKHIKEDLNIAIHNTKIHEDIKIGDIINQEPYFKVEENMINLGTIDTILKLRSEGVKGHILALNFASATNPGGGFLVGSTAQEESLCRASGLYPCIAQSKIKEFYDYHKAQHNPIYSDKMIYSPNVPVIRNDDGHLLEEYVVASFLTSPAVNNSVAKRKNINQSTVNKAMEVRIEKIISLALEYNPEVLILGAFGCGVFGNEKAVVYKLFENAINKLVPKDTMRIVFGVIDTPKS